MAFKNALPPGIVVNIFDAATLGTGASDSYGLLGLSSQVTYQYFFTSNPTVLSLAIQTSLDNSHWVTVALHTTLTGDTGTICTSAPFIRANVIAVTGGSVITLQMISKVGSGPANITSSSTSSITAIVGETSVAYGANPTEATVGTSIPPIVDRAGIQFVQNGHPNMIALRLAITGVLTDSAVVTVGAGDKIRVYEATYLTKSGNTLIPALLVGFGLTTTPTTTGVILSHPGCPAGSGVKSGTPVTGTAGQDLRITTSDCGGTAELFIKYATITEA